jgi:hypothetical protein
MILLLSIPLVLTSNRRKTAVENSLDYYTRLLALAHRFEKLVRDGQVRDYAELARLGHVSRARLSQIMNFLNLAPDIQEAILFLPTITRGAEPIYERELRPIMANLIWSKQRRMWVRLGRFQS